MAHDEHTHAPDHHSHHHSRPHLAEPTAEPPGEDWLEVFYDLIFGVAIIELCTFLDSEPPPDLARFLQFVGLLIPIWWVWMGWTVYALRFDADDTPHRLLTFVQVLAIAAMSVQIHDAEAGSRIFAGAFVVARLSLLALYWRAQLRVPGAAQVTGVYYRGFGAGILIWAVSIFLPAPIRYWLWAIGLAVEFATPWLGRASLQRIPLDASHLLDRLGAFTSIILGVAVAGVVTGVADMHWNARSVVGAVLGFIIAVCIWWIRAEFVGRSGARLVRGGGQSVIYANLPIVIGLATLSVGVERALTRAASGEDDPVAVWLLGGGAAIWMLANAILQLALARRRSAVLALVYTIAILIAVLTPIVAPRFPAPLPLAALAACFFALTLTECAPSQPVSSP